MMDFWPARRAFKLPLSVHMQWNGTDVALDFTCHCGERLRFTGWFCQLICCSKCHDHYWLNDSVEIVELTDEEKARLGRQPDKVYFRSNADWRELETARAHGRPALPNMDTLKRVWPIERAHPQPGAAFVHYKGTLACIDFHCTCKVKRGDHLTDVASHFLGCSDCKRIFWLSPFVEALRLSDAEREEFEAYMWTPRNPLGAEELFEG
jgi:hypothetical protein